MVAAFFQELLNHFLIKFGIQVELHRVMHHKSDFRSELWDRQMVTNARLEFFLQLDVASIVFGNALIKCLDLWPDHRGGQVAHAEGIVRDSSWVVLKFFLGRNSNVLAGKSFVSTSVHSCLCCDIWVVRQEKAAFSRVDHFVGLTANCACHAHVTRVLVLVSNAKRVGAIFQKDCVVLVTQILDPLHISQLSSHMRDENMLAVGVFL
mmetsp:Transcript_22834/g.63491  ORF Transcript_22834/g.63491 Transcript_22834/m.63491 type:complete len:207 (+) Transcript_22834:1611-2231(+)